MPAWGLTAGLAGIGQGLPTGIQESQRLIQNYEGGVDQASQIAFGRTLQMLGAGSPMGQGMPPPQGGQRPMGGMPGMPQPQQMAGPPPMAQGNPPMAPPQQGSGTTMGFNQPSGGPNAPFASRFPSTMPTPQGPSPITAEAPVEASDPTRAGGYAALYATMPGGQLPQQAQPAQYQPPGQQGWGPQGQPQQGQLDWRQILQAVTAANPGAPPQVIAGAVNRAIPLMNSQAQMEWKQFAMQRGLVGIDQRQQTIDQRQQVVDAIKKRTNALYPDSMTQGGNYFQNRAAATATGRYEALTKPEEGGGGATPQSAMRTESVFAGGPEGRAVRSFNVVTQHLGVLQQAVDALQNGNVQRLNEMRQTFAQEFGSPVPTNFDAVKTIVTNEMNKAIIGGAGAVFDRAEIQSTLSKAQSPAQLKGVIQNYIKLAAGQLQGLQKEYEAGTGKKDFDQRFISPTTKTLMGGSLSQGSEGKQDPLGIR